jgi:NACHT domain
MPASIDDRVLDFYGNLFDQLFSEPFRTIILERRRRNVVIRQVEDATDAASSSLTRFFQNQKLSEQTVEGILEGFSAIGDSLALENISNSNVTTEEIVETLLNHLPCPETVQQTHDAVYRLALHTVVQVLMQVGPVMAEWQKLNFSSTFELPRRVVNRLNEISDQINALGQSGQSGADERYEIQYRDYLLQRFHKVEAGTVRMTTSLDVDLRELFVMPRVVKRKSAQDEETVNADASLRLMDLAAARQLYGDWNRNDRFLLVKEEQDSETIEEQFHTALEQVKRSPRMVIIGLPGAGKSTFFEWLQVKLASLEEQFILGDQQAIPLMLRVRQLNLWNLPTGAALIEKATASKDRADLMPHGWIDRQMKAGRILLMLDGLDETEPELLKQYLLPWLFGLLKKYPRCHYLISSRPVGYPPGLLQTRRFAECDLLDFKITQIDEYTRHWCTAVRLARNETEAEARREGAQDGKDIVEGFQQHPYIRDLARNPLMLSAICLVNYFERGRLPEDRALLYRLCVEGLLHNWDQRRGIRSEFGFDEKLRACREIALAMQKEDRAEYEATQVKEVFTVVLDNAERATQLLEHIRYRTGLLLERRPNVFGFAHLTFQEYLAARAVHEGNQLGVDAKQLVQEHDDGRWKEVIALYCGLATMPAVKDLINQLIDQPDTALLGEILTEAYLSASSELAQDRRLRNKVLERVAIAPGSWQVNSLHRFSTEEIAPIANTLVGNIRSQFSTSEAYYWLANNSNYLDETYQLKRLNKWKSMTPFQISELIHTLHNYASDETLEKITKISGLYGSLGPKFERSDLTYHSQAEIAWIGLSSRNLKHHSKLDGFKASFRKILPVLINSKNFGRITLHSFESWLGNGNAGVFINLLNSDEKKEFSFLLRQLAEHWKSDKLQKESRHIRESKTEGLENFLDLLEGIIRSEN